MHQKILGKKLMFVTAHPDDESFLAAGTMFLNHAEGGENTLFCATKGEQGVTYLEKDMENKSIKVIREVELRTVAKAIGIVHMHIDDFPDSYLENHEDDIKNNLFKYVKTISPDIVISFGADGFTGHKDHIVIGKIAKETARDLHIPFAVFSHPPSSVCEEFKKFLNNKQIHDCYIDKNTIHQPNIHIQTDPEKKLEILSMYESQFKGLDPYKIFPKDVALHFLSNEYFYGENAKNKAGTYVRLGR